MVEPRPGKEILVVASAPPVPYVIGSKGLGDSMRLARLDSTVLRDNLANFLASMNEVFAGIPKLTEPYKVDEIEVTFEITAEGSIQLIGGVKAGATGGLTLKLKR